VYFIIDDTGGNMANKRYIYSVAFQLARQKKTGELHKCHLCLEPIPNGNYQFIWMHKSKQGKYWQTRFHENCFPKFVFVRAELRKQTTSEGRPWAKVKYDTVTQSETLDWNNADQEIRRRRRSLLLYMNRDLRIYEQRGDEKQLHNLSSRLVEYSNIGYYNDIRSIVARLLRVLTPKYQAEIKGAVAIDPNGNLILESLIGWHIRTFPPRGGLVEVGEPTPVGDTKGNRRGATKLAKIRALDERLAELPRRNMELAKQRADSKLSDKPGIISDREG